MGVARRLLGDRLWDPDDVKESLRYRLTGVAFQAIKRLNPYKDRGLSWALHQMADDYDPRPTGQWEPEERDERVD